MQYTPMSKIMLPWDGRRRSSCVSVLDSSSATNHFSKPNLFLIKTQFASSALRFDALKKRSTKEDGGGFPVRERAPLISFFLGKQVQIRVGEQKLSGSKSI